MIDEFLDEVERDEGGVAEDEEDGHREGELGGGVPGRLVVDCYLQDHLGDSLKEEFGEDLHFETVLEGRQL